LPETGDITRVGLGRNRERHPIVRTIVFIPVATPVWWPGKASAMMRFAIEARWSDERLQERVGDSRQREQCERDVVVLPVNVDAAHVIPVFTIGHGTRPARAIGAAQALR
jgi:hypothetical protein